MESLGWIAKLTVRKMSDKEKRSSGRPIFIASCEEVDDKQKEKRTSAISANKLFNNLFSADLFPSSFGTIHSLQIFNYNWSLGYIKIDAFY